MEECLMDGWGILTELGWSYHVLPCHVPFKIHKMPGSQAG